MRFFIIVFILIVSVSLFLIKVDTAGEGRTVDIIRIDEPELYSANVVRKTSDGVSNACSVSTNGHSFLLKKLNANYNIFEKNAKNRWPIASLTKLMTGVIALEKIGLEKEVIISKKAVLTEGTAGDFKTGEVFRTEDLLKAMLLVSSNDAAIAIAEAFDTGFIDEMKHKAAELKMFQTTFFDPTGLSFVNQSTVSDLAKLANYIYRHHPEIFEITRQKTAEIIELKSGRRRKLTNINEFAGQPDFLGGKSGYIDEAGRNLISIFDVQGQPTLVIALGADNAFEETKKLLACISLTSF